MPNARTSPLARTTASFLLATAGLLATSGMFGGFGPAAPALAQPAKTTPGSKVGQPPSEQAQRLAWLNDWIHYTNISRFDLARENAQALLNSGISDTEFVALVDDVAKVNKRFEEALQKGHKQAEVEAIAGKLQKKYEAGRLAHARNAPEISRNIALLKGTQREKLLGSQRLVAAGEYAMPQLLQVLLDRADTVLSSEVQRVITSLGRQAIIPLCTALSGLDAPSEEIVIGVLGEIPYATSLPFIYDLRSQTKSDPVKRASDRAILRITGVINPEVPVAERYLTLANDYYRQPRSLTSFPDEDVQLLWSFNPGGGLFPTAIATPVYHEAMAMRLTERALALDAPNSEALALWLAANFSREIDTPPPVNGVAYENPAYPKDRRDAMYYAVAAGAAADQRVLARAIDTRNTPLARRAIAATQQTAGGSGLWTGDANRKPLLEAVAYPNRRVQYEAAMAIAAAQPRAEFEGSNRVVPILASATRDAGARYALVIAANAEQQTGLAGVLRAKGFTVLPPARQLNDAAQAIAEAPGIDLILSQLPNEQTEELISQVKGRPNLAATPILALVTTAAYTNLGSKHSSEAGVRFVREGVTPDQVAAAAEQLLEVTSGPPVTPEEAKQYKERALAVLRDLAVSANGVLNVGDAAGPLMTALADSTGPLRIQIAEVLSYIPSKPVQVALMDAALTAAGDDQIALMDKAAHSAKLSGNMLEPRQVTALVKLATGGATSDQQATAAAAVMGALNLPNADLIPLIIGKAK